MRLFFIPLTRQLSIQGRKVESSISRMSEVASAPVEERSSVPSSPSQDATPIQRTSSIAHSLQRRPTRPSAAPNTWMYELRPSHELPVVDLSVSVKSRFLGPRMLAAFSRMVSHRRLLLAGAVSILVIGPVCLAVDPQIGGPLSIVAALSALPPLLAGASLLRYNLTKLLLWTYDVQLFLLLSATTLAAFIALLRDVRCVLPVLSFVGLLPNIFIDANLRAVQAVTLLTGLHVLSMGVSTLELMVDLVPGVQTNVAIVRYGEHALPAKMFVTNGLVTITVMLLRNFYRKRRNVFHRKNPALQNCVSYRARLHLRLAPTRASSMCIKSQAAKRSLIGTSPAAIGVACNTDISCQQIASGTHTIGRRVSLAPRVGPALVNLPRGEAAVNEFVQQLRYDRAYWAIDARNTVWPAVFASIMHPPASARQRLVAALFQSLGAAAFAVSVLAFPADKWLLPDDDTSIQGEGMPVVQCIALALTLMFMSWVLALVQRDLLRTVVLSFDFAYLSAHLMFLCWCMCDFFLWNHHFIMIFVSCLWLHFPLCIDALTPPVRARLGVHVRQVAVVLALVTIGSSATASYLLVFNPVTSASVFDRVVVTVQMPGAAVVEIRILPFFYSAYFTAFLLMLRFVFRAATYGNDDLIVIDGPVVFSNCFHQRTTETLPARGDTNRRMVPPPSAISPTPLMMPDKGEGL